MPLVRHPSLLITVSLCALAATAPASIAPRSVTREWMHRTWEVGSGGEHFCPVGPRYAIPDRHGGHITARLGVRCPTADGKGQLIFFFHNRHFLGWDSVYESLSISTPRRHGDHFVASYALYGKNDPLCCPSGSVKIRYRWTGTRIKASRAIPRKARGYRRVRVELR